MIVPKILEIPLLQGTEKYPFLKGDVTTHLQGNSLQKFGGLEAELHIIRASHHFILILEIDGA